MYSAKILMEAEILARDIMMIDFLSTSEKKEKYLKPLEDIDSKPIETVVEKLPDVYARHPEPAQETPEERQYRFQQMEYERNGSYAKNKKLAISINSLAERNFTNKILAAACNFTEMAENHPRSIFIQTFGELIEEELKENPTKPSQRLASFTTAYFWKEANLKQMVQAIPAQTTRDELLEFFKLPLNSEPEKKVVDTLYPQTIGEIVYATADKENKSIKFDFRKDVPYLSLDRAEKLEKSITELSQQNFTNRILTSTSHFGILCNPFNSVNAIKYFGLDLEQELQNNPDKASPRLVTLMTEQAFKDKDIKTLIDCVTPETTKEELSEFFTTRENWSTGLRMIDYLNHHVVVEMTRFLPEQDRLEMWNLRPEMITGVHVDGSLKKLSPESQTAILDTITDTVRKEAIRENMKNELIGLRVTFGLTGGGNINPNTLDIFGQFADIRKRRICSHNDNKKFFANHEKWRSSFSR